MKYRRSVEERLTLHMRLSRLLRAADRFEEAEREWIAAYDDVKDVVEEGEVFTTEVDFRQFLVVSDGDGDVTVEPVERI